jgi:serine phosphatase RsbU (regulator of sigma subunit)
VQKGLVEEKNKQVTDSITYAKRIQTALMPSLKTVNEHLPDSFVIYFPKDIVAGDFYWMEAIRLADSRLDDVLISKSTDEVNQQIDNQHIDNQHIDNQHISTSSNQHIEKSAHQLILLAACDCTGHGVPGAMVSVVCNNALNRAVREFDLTQPAAILNKTEEIVTENFAKNDLGIKDGMDISLVSIKYNPENNTTELQWAGANNPIWIVRTSSPDSFKDDADEWTQNEQWWLEETKADKQPIGINENNHPFTNHHFTLAKNETFYIFSDGFADQFGGETGRKKLTRKRFKDLILSIQNLTMAEQKQAIETFFFNYKKALEQIDDVLVIGVRI